MSLINISNLTFAYEGSYENIFENVSFQLDTNWRLGFTGRNGRGKTTFFKLLMGKYPYYGNINANVDFDYFPFKAKNTKNLTLDILQEIAPNAFDWEFIREMSYLEINPEVLYRPFETLSKGEQTKAMLCALFLKENNFLLIDEPTNHLDINGRELVSKYLSSKCGFILISHDRALLDSCTDHTLSINKTNIEITKGNFSTYMANRQRQEDFELAQNQKLKKEINRLKQSSAEKSGWSAQTERSKFNTTSSGSKIDRGYVGHKAEKMMKRSKTLEARQSKAIEEKSKLLLNTEIKESLKLSPLLYHSSRLGEISRLTVKYGDKAVCSNISFTIEQGDRIALRGKNGSGKSSVIKLLLGEEVPYSGTVKLASSLIISYVPQNADFLRGSLRDYAEKSQIDESLFKAILRKMDFSREQFEKDMADFSSGQKKKVLIACSLCQRAHLYIWDEPLNYVDILSRIQLEELIIDFKPTMVFVEHDKLFCENVANKVVDFG